MTLEENTKCSHGKKLKYILIELFVSDNKHDVTTVINISKYILCIMDESQD